MFIRAISLLLFFSMAIYGAFDMVRRARGMRAERKYKDAVFAWRERPYLSIKYDPLAWLTVSIHWLTGIAIGLLQVLLLVVLPYAASTFSIFTFSIIVLIAAIVGYQWGEMLFHPAGLFLAGDRHYAIGEEGILMGGCLIPWTAFTHFAFDSITGIVRLWSASCPGATAFMFSPGEPDLPKILELLQSHLPGEDRVSRPSLITQWALPLAMGTICGVLLLAAVILTYKAPVHIGLISNALLMFVLMLVGGQILLRSILGKNIPPAAVEQE